MQFSASTQQQVDRDLNHRTRPGIVVYFLAWLCVVILSDVAEFNPVLVYATGAYLFALVFIRYALYRLFDRLYAANPARWRALFLAGIILTALPWSLFSAWCIVHFGHSFESAIILVSVTMFCAGSIYGFAPSQSLLRLYTLIVAGPSVLVLLWMQTTASVSLAVFDMIFVIVLLGVGRNASLDYMTHLHAEALERATARAELANKVKGEFLANMSHEIRTPLNAVLGIARIGQQKYPGHESRQQFDQILASGRLLSRLINDILELSRIDAGKISIERQPFSLHVMLDATLDMVRQAAGDKGLDLQLVKSGSLPDWVNGDALRLQQVLVNLLTNAIKFTHRGAVTLEVAPGDDAIAFRVVDTGIGMTPEQLARVFEPFEQGDSSTTRLYGGTGLGLTISRGLVEHMGGKMVAHSSPGSGSTFLITVPLAATAAPCRPEAVVVRADSAPVLEGLRVLVADDDEVNRIVIEHLLESEGAQVSFAENGQQVMDIITRDKDFDVVLMDIQMPVMDGYAATRRVKLMEPGLPVIGLTAHALAEDREKCLAAGMSDHVTKPVDTVQLTAAILAQVRAGAMNDDR
ncbi:MAG: ATP-binding protein [Pseudomonadota bacterium]